MPDLTIALHTAATKNEIVRRLGLQVKTNSHFTTVNLSVSPVAARPELVERAAPAAMSETALFMIVLEEAPLQRAELPSVDTDQTQLLVVPDSTGVSGSATEARLATLQQELHAKEEYIQCANEELQASNEELKSSNEELQSVNEEMQSTNEELETSKEELQSVNEELATINAELQTKVLDLSRVNNDMNNLLAGTGIGTVFVDHQLCILRFTPGATQIINLILSDVGRSVGHFASNLVGYDRLVADVQAVLNNLIPKELEVQTTNGNYYLMRIIPYRTVDNKIEGAVINFLNITENKHTRDALKKANDLNRMAVVVRDAHDAIVMQTMEGRILAWNPSAERMYGWSEADALQMNVRELIPEGLRKEDVKRVQQLSRKETVEPYRTQRLTKDGKAVEVWLTATALLNEAGQVYAIATTERTSGVE